MDIFQCNVQILSCARNNHILLKKNSHRNYATIFQTRSKMVNSRARNFYSVRVQWTFRNRNWQNRSDDIYECVMSDILEKRVAAGRLKR